MMKAWWNQRNQRERLFLGSGTVLLVLLLGYVLLWLPFRADLAGLRERVVQQRSELMQMRQMAGTIRHLEQRSGGTQTAGTGRGSNPPAANTPSLPTLVDQTARAAGLGSALKRVEPQSSDRLQIQFERAGFDLMLSWLHGLFQDHGIVIVNMIISRQDRPGTVDARLILQQQGTGS